MDPNLRHHLKTDNAVADLVADRIYAERLPQMGPDAPRVMPAAVFQKVGDSREVSICGTLRLVEGQFQIDSYSQDRDEKVALADAIRTRMVDYYGPMGPVNVNQVRLSTEFDVGPDPEPGLYRRSQTFLIWYWE